MRRGLRVPAPSSIASLTPREQDIYCWWRVASQPRDRPPDSVVSERRSMSHFHSPAGQLACASRVQPSSSPTNGAVTPGPRTYQDTARGGRFAYE